MARAPLAPVVGDGCVRVRLTHAGFAERAAEHPDENAEWEQVRAYFAKAWPTVLEMCRKHFTNASRTNSGWGWNWVGVPTKGIGVDQPALALMGS